MPFKIWLICGGFTKFSKNSIHFYYSYIHCMAFNRYRYLFSFQFVNKGSLEIELLKQESKIYITRFLTKILDSINNIIHDDA